MSLQQVRRNLVSVQVLVRFGVDRGLAEADCLRDTGISLELLSNPHTEIAAAQELQLVRNLLRGLGSVPGLGLDAGLRYHLSTYGIWGFTLLTCRDFRAVSEAVERYLDLSYAFIRFRIQIEADRVEILLDDAGLPDDVRQFFLERDFAAWANAMAELQMSSEQLPVRGVRFSFPRPAYAERFAQLCGVEPVFGASDNRIQLHPAVLDAPLPQSNPAVARLCLEQCRQLLEKRQLRTGIAGQVRDQLFHMSGRMPTLDGVAAQMKLSPRSLRRQLENEGTSFRTLCDEVLEALSEELLTVAEMKLEEVAQRLGYAEPASFIHAFKRWKGMSPSAFRQQRHRPAA